jgi:dihydrofolate reductase
MKVILMMAQTADGIIAKDHRHLPDWTCPADKRLFKTITQEAGVMIMGSHSYATIGGPLPGRLNVVYTRHPERLPQAENVMFTAQKPSELLSDLAYRGHSTAILTGGASVNSLFAKEALIDEILLTVSPRIFGTGLTLFAGAVEMELSLMEHRLLDQNTILLHYRVVKGSGGHHQVA